ncbi:MAG: aminoglycoside phosphotransferase family protein [Candidatus Tectimicrobiota bacterium]
MQARDMLTEPYLQRLLQEAFPRARKMPSLTPLAADASTRRYVRLHWGAASAAHPASCVIMYCAPWPTDVVPDFLSVGQHLRAHGVHVPEVYGVAPEAGLMCLEDYGDSTLASQWQTSPPATRLLWGQRAMDELVKLHTRATVNVQPACPAFGLAFDVPKLLSELQYFREHAIEGLWQRALGDDERAALDAAFAELCTFLAAAPHYFCHRDYHGWNVMAHQQKAGVLDFQDARMGPQPYDLASLLTDRGTPVLLGQAALLTLCDYYVERMQAETGQGIDRAAFTVLFDHVAVQRCLKATGTFAAMTVLRGRPQYQPYIAPTLTYVQTIMQRYATLRPLLRLLRRYLPS